MPKFKGPRAPARQPTPHADLNAVIADLVAGAREALQHDFVGAYLLGSFAVGDADEASDVDFVVVTRRDLAGERLDAVRALHHRLHDYPSFWAQRLEGSYFPADVLRRLATEPRDPPAEPPRPADWKDPCTGLVGPRVYPIFFKGNGERDLVRSEHDNTQVVRWVAREKGIVLAGPEPHALIEPVSAADLAAEIRMLIRAKAPMWVDEAYPIDQNWIWAFFVTLGCRMLQSLETGRVGSKKQATAWGLAHLDDEWRELIETAWAIGRAELEVRIAPAPAERAAAARVFTRHVIALEAAMPEVSAAEHAQAVIARRLAEKRAAHPPGARIGPPPRGPGGRGPRGAGPPPIRPGGRGRRG